MSLRLTYNDSPRIKHNDTKFVRALKTLIWIKKINQEQLAKILGIRQSQVSNLLNGKSMPSYFTLQQLKNHFDIDINHYFD